MSGAAGIRTSAREGERRRRELLVRIGRQVGELRTDASVSTGRLAACVGIHRAYLGRIERGVASPSLEGLGAIADCLGADLGVRLFPVAGPRLHDRFQAPMVEALIRELGPAWRRQPEVVVPAARGVIDLVLTRALDHLTVACECHSELRRLEAVLRRGAEKAEGLRGSIGEGQTLSRLLVLRSTRATREVAKAYEATLAAAYPARSADAFEALRGNAAWPGPAIVWANVERGRAEILDRPPRGVRLGR
jgi:transcriptional regulator with XRE-family HTH domain